jgi:hypothetical protein
VNDHQGQGLSGEWAGEGPRRGVGLPRPLSRGGAAEDAAPSAGRLSRFPQAGGCSPLRESPAPRLPISAGDPSNGADDRIAAKCHSKGRSFVASPTRAQTALALDCDLSQQNHWHLSGWTGQSRGRAARRAIVNRTPVLDLAFQLRRPGPSASQCKPDPLIDSRFRGRGSAALAVALQPLIKIVSCETDVVLHPAAVGTLKVQQVHGAFNRHRR